MPPQYDNNLQPYYGDDSVPWVHADLRNDIECATRQAAEGPFYPERGITATSLLEYAEACRQQLARIRTGRDVRDFVAGKL